jgi:uncharacterized protein (DUF4415 family)
MGDLKGILAILVQDGRFPISQGIDPVKPDRLRTIAQEKAYAAYVMQLQELEIMVRHQKLKDALVPRDWHTIEEDVPVQPPRTKLTVEFDADMVKWFRGMGTGYQARMNAVLRAFMLALISKEILSRGDKDWKHDEIWGKAAPKKKKEEE